MSARDRQLPSHARVVIIGGGIMGVSLLYHLALEGWSDLVLLEKGELTSGSTWHAAGQVASIIGDYNLSTMNHYANKLYQRLENTTGQKVNWHGCGGIRIATREEELDWFRHIAGFSESVGFPYRIISPEEIRRIYPFLTLDGVIAGAWTTQDGHVDPASACNAVAAAARQLGATIHRNTLVTNLARRPGGEWEVQTPRGNIVSEHVVNAAGCYAPQVGAMVGVTVPIINMEHQYLLTEASPEIADRDEELPVLRDPTFSGYCRQEGTSLLVGIYEQHGAQEAWEGRADLPSWETSNELFPPNMERIIPWLGRAMDRLPLIGKLGIRRVINGAIAHTPDGMPLLGPAGGMDNFWMCCGSSIGIAQGPGCGMHLARWMVHGAADISMQGFDPRRFGNHADRQYSYGKVIEDFQRMFTVHVPGEELTGGRPKVTTPLFERLGSKGAVFGEAFGWERANYFSANGDEGSSFRRSGSFERVRDEALAVRSGVGVIDLSSFSKFEVSGDDAGSYLDRLVMGRLPRRTGGVALAYPLSDGGRMLSELVVTKLGDNRYYLTSAAASRVRDLDILNGGRSRSCQVRIADITDSLGVLVLSGPRSRDLMEKLTGADCRGIHFPWLSARKVVIGGMDVRALRINYTGELGWELHVNMGSLGRLYSLIEAAGEEHGLRDYGIYALNSLRIEKAYRGWGTELANDVTPLEAGLDRFVDFDKEFTGRRALLEQKANGAARALCLLEVAAIDSDARGGEPVFRNDRLVGLTTSGGFGYATNRSLAFAYMDPASLAPDGSLSIDLLGTRVEARILRGIPYDECNSRQKE